MVYANQYFTYTPHVVENGLKLVSLPGVPGGGGGECVWLPRSIVDRQSRQLCPCLQSSGPRAADQVKEVAQQGREVRVSLSVVTVGSSGVFVEEEDGEHQSRTQLGEREGGREGGRGREGRREKEGEREGDICIVLVEVCTK